MSTSSSTTRVLERVRTTLLATAKGFPTEADVTQLRQDLAPAIERGYFTPTEDERIRELYSRYLHARTALHIALQDLRKHLPRWNRASNPEAIQAFTLGWASGCILMRAARYVVTEFYQQPILRKLLNEAEPRYGIPENSLDQIYRSATHPLTILRFLHAAHFAEKHTFEIEALSTHPDFAAVLDLLEKEKTFIERQTRKHAHALLQNRWSRLRAKPVLTYRRVMWEIFETSGRAIAEMRNPFHRKRVPRKLLRQVSELLQPGDILVTRHDDAMSNLFLPGFWPHSALIIGHPEQRQSLGLSTRHDTQPSEAPLCVLEAKKDGVRFRALRETLAVDAFVLLRPRNLSPDDIKHVLERAFTHEGKLYDFSFDFTRPDRLVCTEVVYRSYDGIGNITFTLQRRAGRYTFSAEDLLRQSLQTNLFEVVLLFGIPGNQIYLGERARQILLRSFNY